MRAPLGLAAGTFAAVLALRLRDPHRHGAWGLCPFKLLTGWDCPACGGLRAVNDLTHLDVGAAWHSNAVFVVSVPLLLLAWSTWLRRSWSGEPARRLSPRLQYVIAMVAGLVITAFTIWRNTPWGTAFHVA